MARPDLDDATALYAHYCDHTGTPMAIDLDEAYAEDAGVRAAVDTLIQRAQARVARYHAQGIDRFNHGAHDIQTGAPDNENGRFATLGWAKAFQTHGSLDRTVTWTLDDPSGSSQSGGDGPGRHSPGEDRIDGRSGG